ncbi:hypothetical protein, partial [Arthrobacter sp. DR-2P]
VCAGADRRCCRRPGPADCRPGVWAARVPGAGGAPWPLRRRHDHQPLRGVIVPPHPFPGLAARGLEEVLRPGARRPGGRPARSLAGQQRARSPAGNLHRPPAHRRPARIPAADQEFMACQRPGTHDVPGVFQRPDERRRRSWRACHHGLCHCHPLGAEELQRHTSVVLHHHRFYVPGQQICAVRRSHSRPGRLAVAGDPGGNGHRNRCRRPALRPGASVLRPAHRHGHRLPGSCVHPGQGPGGTGSSL